MSAAPEKGDICGIDPGVIREQMAFKAMRVGRSSGEVLSGKVFVIRVKLHGGYPSRVR